MAHGEEGLAGLWEDTEADEESDVEAGGFMTGVMWASSMV